jgi:quercetin dioxygenase-like cupin family protein
VLDIKRKERAPTKRSWHIKRKTVMIRKLLLLALGIGLGAVGMAATHNGEDSGSVRVISTRDIQEKLDGKDSAVTVVEVTLGPGQAGAPHRHPGPAFVYVLEGEYELGIDDQPTKSFKAGETFYEPAECLHRVSKNPSSKGKTRLVAVVLHPRDAKEIAIPEKTKQ